MRFDKYGIAKVYKSSRNQKLEELHKMYKDALEKNIDENPNEQYKTLFGSKIKPSLILQMERIEMLKDLIK